MSEAIKPEPKVGTGRWAAKRVPGGDSHGCRSYVITQRKDGWILGTARSWDGRPYLMSFGEGVSLDSVDLDELSLVVKALP